MLVCPLNVDANHVCLKLNDDENCQRRCSQDEGEGVLEAGERHVVDS